MQQESPTDATVMTHLSMITNVTVVPEDIAEKQINSSIWSCNVKRNFTNKKT